MGLTKVVFKYGLYIDIVVSESDHPYILYSLYFRTTFASPMWLFRGYSTSRRIIAPYMCPEMYDVGSRLPSSPFCRLIFLHSALISLHYPPFFLVSRTYPQCEGSDTHISPHTRCAFTFIMCFSM